MKKNVLSIPYIFYRKKLRNNKKKNCIFFNYRSDPDLHFLEVDSVSDQNEVDPQHCREVRVAEKSHPQ